MPGSRALSPTLAPPAGGHPAAPTSYPDPARPRPVLAGGRGRVLSGTLPTRPGPRSRRLTGARLPGSLRLQALSDHARLPSLCLEFVGTESQRIPRWPRAAAAGKGPAGGGPHTQSGVAHRPGGGGCEGYSNTPPRLPPSLPEMVGLRSKVEKELIIRISVRRGEGKGEEE